MEQAVETYAGPNLPLSPGWYLDPRTRSSFSVTSASSNRAAPNDSSEKEGYTHTLLFATHTDSSPDGRTDLLLGRKLRGFAKGSINGIGGKLSLCETPLECIQRESAEEINVHLDSEQVHFSGRVRIDVDQGEKVCIAVYRTNLADEQRDVVRGSEEIIPLWYELTQPSIGSELPWDNMRPEHQVYLAPLLHHHISQQQQQERQEKTIFDVQVDFESEPKKEELAEEERPENHRKARSWKMEVFHTLSSEDKMVVLREEDDEMEHDSSGSQASYGTFARRDWG
ncbi:uncharacterized protein UTRI_04034 [Ustilago trichophora]|uniref:Nudix hydrolase domain-containing protein n=1 Tax=Ustilago trichophora TaxID=86804 RepID=A0A5C3E8Q3_9BASI|nr:uncharacterized protein UTRI_04034 [Ustilago trichophora]